MRVSNTIIEPDDETYLDERRRGRSDLFADILVDILLGSMRTPTDQQFLIIEDFLLVQRHEDLGRERSEFRVSDADVSFKAAEECLFRLFSRCKELAGAVHQSR
jgi:hypothetical protein